MPSTGKFIISIIIHVVVAVVTVSYAAQVIIKTFKYICKSIDGYAVL